MFFYVHLCAFVSHIMFEGPGMLFPFQPNPPITSSLPCAALLTSLPSNRPILEVGRRSFSWEAWPPGNVRLPPSRLQRAAVPQIWSGKRLQLHSPSAEQGWQDSVCGCPRGPFCSEQQRQLPAWRDVPGGEMTPGSG